jgi:hypothetical protein
VKPVEDKECTQNRVGHMKSEYDVQSTFEGDNNVLMQQVCQVYLFFFFFFFINLFKKFNAQRMDMLVSDM